MLLPAVGLTMRRRLALTAAPQTLAQRMGTGASFPPPPTTKILTFTIAATQAHPLWLHAPRRFVLCTARGGGMRQRMPMGLVVQRVRTRMAYSTLFCRTPLSMLTALAASHT